LLRRVTAIINPDLLILVAVLAAAALALVGRARAAAAGSGIAFLVLVVGGALPLGQLLLSPLEDRFPEFWDGGRPDPTGIVVLGGALASNLRPGSEFHKASGRVIETVLLAKRFPRARIVYAGGGGEAFRGRKLMMDLGVEPDRITMEPKSTSTSENAGFAAALVSPKPDDRWILVTSAWHMPRAVGSFRAVGFPVEAYPVDYRGLPWKPFLDIKAGLETLQLASKEYIGLFGYWMTGRSSELFPGPARVPATRESSAILMHTSE
jgi:uncharacterized SAM-binding protein YcdF (DUF218 family)